MAVSELQRRLDALEHEMAALKFFINKADGTNDEAVYASRDADSNFMINDPVAGHVPFHARWVPDSITGAVTVPAGNTMIRRAMTIPAGASLTLAAGATVTFV